MKRSAFVELLSMGTAVREYLPALYWLSSAQRVRLARKDKRAGAVDAFLRERNNALEQLLDCLHMDAGRCGKR